jgi:glycosyltransferase involved in cell wall biosynthesis
MTNVLFVSNNPLTDEKKRVTGPELRILRLASQLAEYGHNVSITEPMRSFISTEDCNLNFLTWSKFSLRRLAKRFDVVVIPQWGRSSFAYFRSDPPVPTVVDVYCPILMESLFTESSIATYTYARALPRIAKALQKGDFFICGSERQLCYYMGMLSILGRITPLSRGQNLLSIVPYCVPNVSPATSEPVIRGKIIDNNDKMLLWCGGLYPWFDFKTLIKAMKIVGNTSKEIKLVVIGAKNPKAEFLSTMDAEALSIAKKFDLLEKTVFFVDWMPFRSLEQVYNESDVAVSLHGLHLETMFSLRSRVIDYLWAGLPVISTLGDELAVLISEFKAGVIVPPHKDCDVAEAILTILGDRKLRDSMSSNARQLAVNTFSVKSAAMPLNEFCKKPHFAEDKFDFKSYKLLTNRVNPKLNPAIDLLLVLHYARKTQQKKGYSNVIKKALEFLKFG